MSDSNNALPPLGQKSGMGSGLSSKIRFNDAPTLGKPEAPEAPVAPPPKLHNTDPLEIDVMETGESGMGKIRTFGKSLNHGEAWKRTPNVTGQGAIHVKTFFAKLREDALEYMDKQINEWLDAHPEYEVKFTTSTIGELTGKLKEPALFVAVWV